MMLLNNTTEALAPVLRTHSWRTFIEVAILSIIACVGLVGNTLVISVIYRSRRTTWTTNVFVSNLAGVNLVVPLFCAPMLIYYDLLVSDPKASFPCKLVLFFHMLNSAVSVAMLSCMTLDRFFVIAYPLSVHFSRDDTWRLIILIWFLLLCACGPSFYFARIRYVSPYTADTAACRDYDWRIFISLFASIAICVPLVFVLIVNIGIAIAIRQRNSTQRIRILYAAQLTDALEQQHQVGFSTAPRRSKDLGRVPLVKRETVKMMVIQDILYAVCWLPYFSGEVYLFDRSGDCDKYLWLMYIAFSNAAVNPILYAAFNSNFRRGCRHLFRIHLSSPYSVSYLGRQKNRVGVVDAISVANKVKMGFTERGMVQRDSLFGIKISSSRHGSFAVQTTIETRMTTTFVRPDRKEAWVS